MSGRGQRNCQESILTIYFRTCLIIVAQGKKSYKTNNLKTLHQSRPDLAKNAAHFLNCTHPPQNHCYYSVFLSPGAWPQNLHFFAGCVFDRIHVPGFRNSIRKFSHVLQAAPILCSFWGGSCSAILVCT